ncbi:MAG: CsbD family protein [Alphaproteobacteria bacterium]|nr:CsbD family protein [Alphaproteobacteria bacterium]
MNQEQVDGKFTQLKGKIKETWGKLTDNDVTLFNGQRDQFLGKLKEHYGLGKEDAEKKIKEMEDDVEHNQKHDSKTS